MRWLAYVPKSYLSWSIGKLANMPVPWPLNYLSISVFARCYSIDVASADRPLSSFRSVGDFFTRDLRPELRPIGETFVSPVDGRLRVFEDVPSEGTLTQCKGKEYSTAQLLADEELAASFRGGSCFNFYLSPSDAHHIYSPCDGEIIKTIHVPGKLWPVNNWALSAVDNLFAVNERVVTLIKTPAGLVAVVMVGATNVGRIRTHYTLLETNKSPWKQSEVIAQTHSPSISVARGQKIGTFHMGSSVLVLTQFKFSSARTFVEKQVVKYGEKL